MHTNDVDAFSVDESGLCATFSGPARVNGEPAYFVEVSTGDFGKPGAGSDVFRITLTHGGGETLYENAGVRDGGNVQMHSQ